MSGIYVHIPFCPSRCIYCDFFSSTSTGEKDRYVDRICEELTGRKDYLQGEALSTIYFGGGTPSQLSSFHFEQLFDRIIEISALEDFSSLEITLEANPEDITRDYLESIKHLPFNRISLGIQSFDDKDLTFLGRRHNASSAIRAVELCREYGFRNISIDLMYGLPNQSLAKWEENINQALALGVQHISAYHLIYETGTRLAHIADRGEVLPVDEDISLQMFELLIDKLATAGFEHYEISNFAIPSYRSRHNSSYWNDSLYLGIGASAHSYNRQSRQWNQNKLNYDFRQAEIEEIDDRSHFNDYVLTRLRTKEGIDLNALSRLFGEEKKAYILKQAAKYLDRQTLEIREGNLVLQRDGIFISDMIMADLLL